MLVKRCFETNSFTSVRCIHMGAEYVLVLRIFGMALISFIIYVPFVRGEKLGEREKKIQII